MRPTSAFAFVKRANPEFLQIAELVRNLTLAEVLRSRSLSESKRKQPIILNYKQERHFRQEEILIKDAKQLRVKDFLKVPAQ